MTVGNDACRGGLHVATSEIDTAKAVYWHRELPPLDTDVMGEHTIEAVSERVSSRLAHRDKLWEQCYRDLMHQTSRRLEQEIARLGGHYAHVVSESIEARRDDARGEAWLRGRFTYVLYRRNSAARVA
jgi:hypothetical protein